MNILLMAITVLPPIAIIIYVYMQDKIEKESFKLLRKLLFWGALSIFPVMVVEIIMEYIITAVIPDETTLLFVLADNIIGVACIEEAAKYFVIKKKTWNNPEFNFRFDGIIYAVTASLGFALLENILYVFDGGFETAILRALTSIPGHAAFGVFMGIYFGEAKYVDCLGKRSKSKRYLRLAVIVPVLLHGTYDFVLSYIEYADDVIAGFLIIISIVFDICLDVAAIKRVKAASKSDVPFEEYYSMLYEEMNSVNE